MKKTKLLIFGVLAVLLAGCGNNQATSKKDTTTDSTTTSAKKESKKKHTNSNSSSSASSTDKKNDQTKSDTTTTNLTRLQQLNNELTKALGQVILPQVDGLSNADHDKVNVRYIGDNRNYSIYYSLGYNAYPFNDEHLKQHVPYAVLSKKTYDTQAQARENIHYFDVTQSQDLPKVDLGYKIEGVLDSGAGQSYLQWNEGNWSLSVHASAYNGQETIPTGRQIVSLLEQQMLPAPNDRGSFAVDMTTNEVTLTWMKENIVYTLEGKDVNTLVSMAASLK